MEPLQNDEMRCVGLSPAIGGTKEARADRVFQRFLMMNNVILY